MGARNFVIAVNIFASYYWLCNYKMKYIACYIITGIIEYINSVIMCYEAWLKIRNNKKQVKYVRLLS